MDFYDWRKTFSYDADVTMVVGGRGIGKTFGLRCQLVRDFLRDGFRFVAVCRYKNELADVSRGFFDRVEKMVEFEKFCFKTEGRRFYIGEKTSDGSKPSWKLMGYAVALTEMQKSKQSTFSNVYRIVLDEAILDRLDRFHRYLPNEFLLLANLVDSCSREIAGQSSRPPRVYLLGNAVDLINPYFERYGISEPPKFGYHWYSGKSFLLHYVESGDYAVEKASGTVAGRMLKGSEAGRVSAENVFQGANMDFVEARPKGCRFECGIVCFGERYGVWWDPRDCYFHVDNVIPKQTSRPVFALTRSDNRVNMVMVKRSNKSLQSLVDLAMEGLFRYESVAVRERFLSAMSMFGIR